jgi:predicted phage tail protein
MTDKKQPIVGAFGGGGSGGGQAASVRSPSITADNLASIQYAKVLDLIGEGELEGFPSARNYTRGTAEYNTAALKDIYLNNTPILRAGASLPNPLDTDYNFKDVTLDFRYGTQDQRYNGFTTTQREQIVNVEVTNASPVTRTITDTDVDQVRITLNIPQMAYYVRNGDVRGVELTMSIQLSYNGGPYTTVLTDKITGRTADLYQKKYNIQLDEAGAFPVSVRVLRDTPDRDPAAEETIVDNVFWSTFTEVTETKLRYPNSAIVGLRVSSEQFSSIPNRTYRIRGIKIRIPSNATVDQETGRLIYSGVWDGTFAAAQWCSCPAWILWDLLTASRYGLGDYISADQLDKWAFFQASQYSNELVPDGFGGTEARFSCNVNIQTAEEAYKLINDMCSVMRCMPYWSTGALTISQDRPQPDKYIFSLSNVTEAGFQYSGSDRRTRHTVAVVSYLDLETRDIAYENVEDPVGIAKYGINKTEISAFACTSRGQARRIGEWLLYSEQNETEVVSFTCSIDGGTQVRPGDLIRINDPVKAGERRGGRIVSATTNNITVDNVDEMTFPSGANPILSVILPDGQFEFNEVVSRSGTTFTVAPGFSSAPAVNSPWFYRDDTIIPARWRVISVQEQDGALYGITAVSHDPGKYNHVERGVELQARDVSNLNAIPVAPTDLAAEEYLYESNGQVLNKIVLSWAPVIGVMQYRVQWRLENGNYSTFATRGPDYEFFNTSPGRYTFRVIPTNALQQEGPAAELTFNALGKTAPPETIPDLFIAPIDEHTAELYWPQSVDLDVRIGGQIRIRHTSLIDGTATWGKSNDIVPAVNGSSTRKIVPLLEGTYFIRAVDSLGNESAGTASVVVDLPEPQDRLLVQEYREEDNSPPFNGTPTDMAYNATEVGLILTADTLVDDMATDGDWDALGLIDYIGGTVSEGSYVYSETLDLGGVYDLGIQRILQTRAFEPGNTWDDRLDLIDLWDDIDGDDLGAANCQIYVRTTNDDTTASPTWGIYQPFVNNTARGRGFQFKVVATSSNPAQNVVIEELGVSTHLERRTEIQSGLSSGTSAYSVTFPKAFYAAPSVGITAQDMDQGDYFTISNKSRTGFDITFRDSGGSIVSKTFDYQAVGHGREIT